MKSLNQEGKVPNVNASLLESRHLHELVVRHRRLAVAAVVMALLMAAAGFVLSAAGFGLASAVAFSLSAFAIGVRCGVGQCGPGRL